MCGHVVGSATLSAAPESIMLETCIHLVSQSTFQKLEVHGLCELSVLHLISMRASLSPWCTDSSVSSWLLLNLVQDFMLTSVHIHDCAKNLELIIRLHFHAPRLTDRALTAAIQTLASYAQAWVSVTVTRHKVSAIDFLRQNLLFSDISEVSDREWVYEHSHTENSHTARSPPCSEPPRGLASSRPIQTKWCHLQTAMHTVPQQNVHLMYLSKSWPKGHSMSSHFRIHIYIVHTASAACAGFFPLRTLLFFPFLFIMSTSFFRHSPTRCPHSPQWQDCPL